MIYPFVKIITIDDYLIQEDARNLAAILYEHQFNPTDFGEELANFNVIPENSNENFSKILNTNIEVDATRSGIFRKPNNLIHFETFNDLNEWIFMVSILPSTINIFDHISGVKSALIEHRFNYRNLFEWDLQVNFLLKPGQGLLFRPWLFHSFSTGLIQIFRLNEH